MSRSKQSRFVAALVALFGMLFMQFAVAAYGCLDLQAKQTDHTVAAKAMDLGHQSMEGCPGVDKAQPNLCDAHGQVHKQSLDKPGSPQLQPFLTLGFALPLFPDEVADRPSDAPQDTLLTRATAPPLSIRNCCFRI